MDVTAEMVAPREVEFTIRPEATRVEEARRQAARQLAKRVRIPGFRPGKAPYVLVERTVGKDVLTEEAAEALAPDLYKQAMEETGYKAYDTPSLRIAQHEPLELKIRVPLEPEVTLGDYCSLRVEPEPPVEVTPEQEEQMLNEVREQHGTWEPVQRAAQMGDQVTVDVKRVVEGETVSDQTGLQLVLSESLTPAGFGEALVGLEPDQTREFELKYPPDWSEEKLAGKTVAFTVALRELKERKLPVLDDEFARSLGDYESVEDLKARLRQGLQARLEAQSRDRLATRILDQLMEQSKIEYPNLAVEREIDRLIRQQDNRLRQQGFTLEAYLRVTHKSAAQLRDELRPQAEENLRRMLLIHQVGEAEKIEVQPEEVTTEIEHIAAAYGEQASVVAEVLRSPESLSSVLSDIRVRKTVDRLIDVVTGKVQGACQAAGAASPEAPAQPGAAAPQTPAAPEQAPGESTSE